MAVQARNFNPFIRRPFLKRGSDNVVTSFGNTTVDSVAISVQRMAPPTDSVLPILHSFWTPQCSVKTAAAEVESGLCSNSVQTPGSTTKRIRKVSTILDDDTYAHIQEQQQLEIENILSQHAENVRMEIMERRRWGPDLFMEAVEDAMAVKVEEMEMLRKMNFVLQERVKWLNVENDAWREITCRNEVEMNRLRSSLDEAMEEKRGSVVEDCVSSSEEGPPRKKRKEMVVGICRRCWGRASTVLVLPCKHLCLCDLCGSTERKCPVCGMNMNVSVHVNLC